MARCRIEYVLGDLVDNFSEDPPESRVARVRKEFLEYGLELPHLQGKRTPLLIILIKRKV